MRGELLFIIGVITLIVGLILSATGLPVKEVKEAPIEVEEWRISWFRIFSVPVEIESPEAVGLKVNETVLSPTYEFDLSYEIEDYSGYSDEIALIAKTQIYAPSSGRVHFEIGSDDGSVLYLDGKLIIDNWGLHGVEFEKTTVELQEGGHTLEIWWFEWHGGEALIFKMDEKIASVSEPWYSRVVGGAVAAVGFVLAIIFRPKRRKI